MINPSRVERGDSTSATTTTSEELCGLCEAARMRLAKITSFWNGASQKLLEQSGISTVKEKLGFLSLYPGIHSPINHHHPMLLILCITNFRCQFCSHHDPVLTWDVKHLPRPIPTSLKDCCSTIFTLLGGMVPNNKSRQIAFIQK